MDDHYDCTQNRYLELYPGHSNQKMCNQWPVVTDFLDFSQFLLSWLAFILLFAIGFWHVGELVDRQEREFRQYKINDTDKK